MRALGALALAVLLSAHVGSPDVFFTGKAGGWDVRVVIQPPEVVPGVARVTVVVAARGSSGFALDSATIRPVYWRAGSRGAPSADPMLFDSGPAVGEFTYHGSLWLMARGAYSVDVGVFGSLGAGHVLVPVASVATGRLALSTPLAATLIVLGLFLVTGLVNIVRKGAGEGLLEPGKSLNDGGVRTSRIAGVAAVMVLALAVFGGSRWWGAVDADYQSNLYKPAPLAVSLVNGTLRVAATDSQYVPGGRPSRYVPDHGKLMHLFLVGDRGFAHLHPWPDSSEVPAFSTKLPPLPAGTYRIYGDVVQETGFERTLVGSVQIPEKMPAVTRMDYDDAWFIGEPLSKDLSELADGTVMQLLADKYPIVAGAELNLRVFLKDAKGGPAYSEPYLGMPGHLIITRPDGEVYTHLHPMGSVTAAAQEVFQARDRGDTTDAGVLRVAPPAPARTAMTATGEMVMKGEPRKPYIDFPYAFPRGGDYRVYVQVRRNGRVQTGAFAITVGDAPAAAK